MRLTFGRGNRRTGIVFPTGSTVGVTKEHVNSMLHILQNSGVIFKDDSEKVAIKRELAA